MECMRGVLFLGECLAPYQNGLVAQLEERGVCNAEAWGSNPHGSTQRMCQCCGDGLFCFVSLRNGTIVLPEPFCLIRFVFVHLRM